MLAPAPEVTPAATTEIGAAPADIPAFMKMRHDNYEDIGKNMKVLQDNMKLDAPDMAAVTAAATKIKGYADQMATWFPAGTGPESGIKTEAKAEIWTDRATFDAAVVKLQEESGKLAAVTDAAAFKAQFPVTGGTCKGCHDAPNSPHFNESVYRKKILGPGHGTPLEKSASDAGSTPPPKTPGH
jgi:cytochrome c556